ncbi:MAG: RHS repeat-associated core domain-containing protein [Candidatus Dormiibacterota bacterium]
MESVDQILTSATALAYNAANQLTSYQVGSGATTTYAYDGDGLRQSKTTGSSTTEFAWNDSDSLPLLLQETTGSATTSYVYGPTGLPLEEVLPSGATYYYSQDDLGSTRVLTDSTGAVANTYTYDAYGNVTAQTGTIQNHLLFCGQYMDSESGFYYLQARYYGPVIAQFITVDPLVEQTQAPYSYVAGDPINDVDLTGLKGCGWNPICNVASAVSTATNWAGQHAVTIGHDAATALAVTSAAASTIAGICEVATLGICTPGAAVLEGTSLSLGAAAMSIDVGLAATGNGTWGQVGLDAIGVVPGLGSFSALRWTESLSDLARLGIDGADFAADWPGILGGLSWMGQGEGC